MAQILNSIKGWYGLFSGFKRASAVRSTLLAHLLVETLGKRPAGVYVHASFLGYAQAGCLGTAVHDDGRANELLQFEMPSVSFGQWANEPSARQYVD